MMRLLVAGVAICAVISSSHGVSTKMDFGGYEETVDTVTSNKTEDEDVEVKHTIVVSTKLRNVNRRGLHAASEGEKRTLLHNTGSKTDKEDSGEVPVINGYRAVETTQIKTPGTRHKASMFPESVFINRNVPDDYDVYPNFIPISNQWKPSSFYNNINWMSQDIGINPRPAYQTPGKFHRGITDDGMSEFYCRKCRELTYGQGYNGCIQQRSSPRYLYETTTRKMKIDGKLAKLN